MSDPEAKSASAKPSWGGPLTQADYAKLLKSWVTPDFADQAMVRRVTSDEGAAILGRRDDGSYAGTIFSYMWPGENRIREYWLRRDCPEIEYDSEGKPRERNKYLGPPGRGNLLYITPSTQPELLNDLSAPIVITEGEKKTLALHRLSRHGVEATNERPRFLAVGLGGVWSFRGTIGKVNGPDGSRRDEKGLIPDLRRLALAGRTVYIVFDSNVHTNPKVAAARRELTAELIKLGAQVLCVNLPKPEEGSGINGVDDLLAAWGPDRVLELFQNAQSQSVDEERRTQAQILCECAEDTQLFHTPDDEAYAQVLVDNHHEIWLLRSKGFKRWLIRAFYKLHRKPPSNKALQDALGYLEAKAQFDSPEFPVFVRVAERRGAIYIDLCNAQWEAVEITAEGWRVVADPPVRFKRSKGMQPLPYPEGGGSLTLLRDLINIGDDDNWRLCLAWLVAACRPTGPYPLLSLHGEQGSAKSTTERLLRKTIDPSAALVRTPAREERDLVIAGSNSWVLAYDNVSGLPPWLSDALCRVATGGGFSTRQLYTDADEVFFAATRPIILNGIDYIADRPDLADRALILNLPSIDEFHRREEKDLYAEFENKLPQILGALYDAVSTALARLPQVNLARKPRMADFAVWAVAAAPALGFAPEEFLDAYCGNRAEAVQETLEGDPVAVAISALMDERTRTDGTDVWEGTCKELLTTLERLTDDGVKRSRNWPKTPRGLSGRLRRLVTFLRESGNEVSFCPRGSRGKRPLKIERKWAHSTATTATNATSDSKEAPDHADAARTPSDGVAAGVADQSPPGGEPSPQPITVNPLNASENSAGPGI